MENELDSFGAHIKKMGRAFGMLPRVSEESAGRKWFRPARKDARNYCDYRPFVDFRLRIRANDTNELLRDFDYQNHSVFFLDECQ